MQILIEKMLNDFERGGLSRRQLAATLTGLAAAAALPAPALAAPSLKAITLNHVTVKVPNLQKTSQWRWIALALLAGLIVGGWLYRGFLSRYLPTAETTALQARVATLEANAKTTHKARSSRSA